MQKYTWEMIVEELIREIDQNKYLKDEKMPSENTMAVRFQVPRSEIRRAYDRLKELGCIYSLQGYGSFFYGKKKKINLALHDPTSFSEKMKGLDISYESHNIGSRRIDYNPLIFEMLNAQKYEHVYEISRLRMIDGEPAALHTGYLSEKNFCNICQDASGITSLYRYMNDCGYQNLSCLNNQIMVSHLTADERRILQIQGYEQGLVISSRCADAQSGIILDVERIIYRCDKFIFDI